MNEDFIPYELAVKLKEKGFKEKTLSFYMLPIKRPLFPLTYSLKDWNKADDCYSAPTISQVLKWLREEKKIHIMIDIWKVDINKTSFNWGYDIVNLTTTHVVGSDTSCANTYELAAIAGIKYCLDNLI